MGDFQNLQYVKFVHSSNLFTSSFPRFFYFIALSAKSLSQILKTFSSV